MVEAQFGVDDKRKTIHSLSEEDHPQKEIKLKPCQLFSPTFPSLIRLAVHELQVFLTHWNILYAKEFPLSYLIPAFNYLFSALHCLGIALALASHWIQR